MRRAAWVAVVALAGAWLLARPDAALGHAALARSEPGENAFLQRAPLEVSLTFTETLDRQNSNIRVLTANGAAISTGPAEVALGGLSLRVTLPPLKPGIYNVLWNNVSTVDGHALQGSFPFTVLNSDGSLPDEVNQVSALATDPDPPPQADAIAVRALSLLGLLLAAGAALVVLLVPRELLAARRARAVLTVAAASGALVLAVATLLSLVLIRDTFPGRSLVELLAETRTGSYWLVRAGGSLVLIVAATALFERRRMACAGVLAGSVACLAAFTATSHAAAGAGSGWGMGIDFLHSIAAVAWIGALCGLVTLARAAGRSQAYRPLLARFSLFASLMVFALLATGLLSSFIQLDSLDRLWTTRYGWTLVTKFGLMAALLSVALYNARRGRTLLVAQVTGEPRRFTRTALTEVLLGGLVFVAAAALTQTTVAKSVFERQQGRPFDQAVAATALTTRLQVDPNRTGLNTYKVTLTDSPGAPISAERVRLTFRYRDDQSVGPSTLVLASTTPGLYLGQGPYLPLEGQWQVEVEVRRPDLDDAKTFFEVRPAGTAIGTVRSGSTWDNPAPGMSWNEFGGLALVAAALGVALFKGKGFAWPRELSWSANGLALAGFGAGSLLLFGVHSHDGTRLPRNPIVADQNSLATGRTIFQQNCASCHGRNGVPPPGLNLNPYPLDLTVHVPQHADGQLFLFISQGIDGSAMRAWSKGDGKLTDEQIWHAVNYLRTLGGVDK